MLGVSELLCLHKILQVHKSFSGLVLAFLHTCVKPKPWLQLEASCSSLWLYGSCHQAALDRLWQGVAKALGIFSKANDRCPFGSQAMIKFYLGLLPSHMILSLLLPESLCFSLVFKKSTYPVLLQLPAVGDMLRNMKTGKTWEKVTKVVRVWKSFWVEKNK